MVLQIESISRIPLDTKLIREGIGHPLLRHRDILVRPSEHGYGSSYATEHDPEERDEKSATLGHRRCGDAADDNKRNHRYLGLWHLRHPS